MTTETFTEGLREGVAKVVVTYMDDKWNVVDKSERKKGIAVEYDAKGEVVARHHLDYGKRDQA